jgi:hypothetical protein
MFDNGSKNCEDQTCELRKTDCVTIVSTSNYKLSFSASGTSFLGYDLEIYVSEIDGY